jgi:hypothetical protein
MATRTLVRSKSTTNHPRTIASELAFIASEQARIATERRIDADQRQHIEDDLRKSERLTREQYCSAFDPCGLYI